MQAHFITQSSLAPIPTLHIGFVSRSVLLTHVLLCYTITAAAAVAQQWQLLL
jgi:hypothetical protein